MSATTKDLFVFIDGFGWELLQMYPEFLSDEIQTQSRTRSVVGYSNTCIPSILTGKQPDEHLQWASFYKAHDQQPFAATDKLRWLPKLLANRPRVRKHIHKYLAETNGYEGYFETYQIPFSLLSKLSYTETTDIFKPQTFNGHANIFKHWADAGVSFKAFYLGSDEAKTDDLCRCVSDCEQTPDKLYLHLNQLDGVLHSKAKADDKVKHCLIETENLIRQCLAALRLGDDSIRLSIFSDHGMCTIENTLNLKQAIQDQSGLRFDEDYFAFYDSTMARFWMNTKAQKSQILEILNAISSGKVISDDERQLLGISYEKLPDYGDVLFLVDPGILISPNDLTKKAPFAMHGYSLGHKASYGIFLSSEVCSTPPESICDVFRNEFESNSKYAYA